MRYLSLTTKTPLQSLQNCLVSNNESLFSQGWNFLVLANRSLLNSISPLLHTQEALQNLFPSQNQTFWGLPSSNIGCRHSTCIIISWGFHINAYTLASPLYRSIKNLGVGFWTFSHMLLMQAKVWEMPSVCWKPWDCWIWDFECVITTLWEKPRRDTLKKVSRSCAHANSGTACLDLGINRIYKREGQRERLT